MKKIIKFIMSLLVLFTITSCKNNGISDKFMIKGNIENTTLTSVDANKLKELVINEESFILAILLNGCSACATFKENVANEYIEETSATIYSIDSLLLDQSESYNNKPTYKVAPSILIYKNGKMVDSTSYSSDNKVFKELDAFKDFIDQYTIEPRLIELSENKADEKLSNKESFVLYVGWYRCGDCQILNEKVVTNYLMENDKKVYYLESDKYRSVKPTEEPILSKEPTEDELLAKENWDNWINFTSKYGFNEYRNGRVPALIYYENGEVKDYLIYRNDVVEENLITQSFYEELIGQSKTDEELMSYHNQKALEFLNKYC